MSAIMRYPITYTADVVKPRHTHGERNDFGEWIDVPIMETTDHEAPISVMWEVDGASHHTRFHHGCHWVPIVLKDQLDRHPPEIVSLESYWESKQKPLSSISTPFRKEEKSRMPNSHTARSYKLRSVNDQRTYPDIVLEELVNGRLAALDAADFRSVKDSTRNASVSLAQTDAHDLLSVDGYVYRRCLQEPMLVFQVPYLENRPVLLTISDERPIVARNRGTFALDNLEEALQYLNEILPDQEIELGWTSLQIVDSSSIRKDAFLDDMKAVAEELFDKLHPHTKTADWGDVEALYDIRLALQMLDMDPIEEHETRLYESVLAIYDFADMHDMGELVGNLEIRHGLVVTVIDFEP